MKEIELTRGQVALVDDVDYEYLMQWKWYAMRSRNGCRPTRKLPRKNGEHKTFYMYTAIAEQMGIDVKLVDHKDQNPLNNQRSNLRSATYSQNLHNRGANSNSKTGIKGVSFDKATGKYQAVITVCGKRHFLGYFNTIPEAAAVVQTKRQELVGEFAHE